MSWLDEIPEGREIITCGVECCFCLHHKDIQEKTWEMPRCKIYPDGIPMDICQNAACDKYESSAGKN
ncbi:MAG: hypothetical protein LBP75_09715 [Planctomycetota bacterium]|jgi:hypothetical protein|nr:hypothetical protein [Planctomycetota bacterium]